MSATRRDLVVAGRPAVLARSGSQARLVVWVADRCAVYLIGDGEPDLVDAATSALDLAALTSTCSARGDT